MDRAKSGNKSSLSSGAACCVNDVIDPQTHVVRLCREFQRTIGVAKRANRIGATTRNDIRTLAFRAQSGGELFHLGIHVCSRRTPRDNCSMQPVQQNISIERVVAILETGTILKQDVTLQPELGCPGSSLARVVRLRRALRDYGVGALTQSVCQQEFKLSSLVATARESGAIVALYPEARSIEMLRKAFQWF
jgi:hypothetical protein